MMFLKLSFVVIYGLYFMWSYYGFPDFDFNKAKCTVVRKRSGIKGKRHVLEWGCLMVSKLLCPHLWCFYEGMLGYGPLLRISNIAWLQIKLQNDCTLSEWLILVNHDSWSARCVISFGFSSGRHCKCASQKIRRVPPKALFCAVTIRLHRTRFFGMISCKNGSDQPNKTRKPWKSSNIPEV